LQKRYFPGGDGPDIGSTIRARAARGNKSEIVTGHEKGRGRFFFRQDVPSSPSPQSGKTHGVQEKHKEVASR